MDERIEDLIVRQVDGELSGAEREELEGALAVSEEARRLLADYTELRGRVGRLRREFAPDIESRLAEVKVRRRNGRRVLTRWLGYAAAVVLVIGAGWWLWNDRSLLEDNGSSLTLVDDALAYIEWEDGRRVVFGDERGDTLVVETERGRVAVDTGGVVSYEAQDSFRREAYRVVIPRGGEYRMRLDDGTMVWLNSMTELEVAAGYGGRERRVRLDGEGYFEVARDTARPFVVETERMDVRVLGTRFNVAAYGDEEEVRATLAEGVVCVRSLGGDSVVLRPGEQAVTGGEAVAVREVDVSLVTAWLGGRYVFDQERLEIIVRQLERWYDVRFEFVGDAVREVRFSGSVSKYDSLAEVVGRLEATSNVHFTRVGDKILVNRKQK